MAQKNASSTPAVIDYQKSTSSSYQDALVKVGISASWLTGNVNASLFSQFSSKKTSLVIRYSQKYYTISFKYDEYPTGRHVDVNDIKGANGNLGQKDPPVYIKSVTYGRSLLILVSSDEEESTLEAAVNAALNSGWLSGSTTLSDQNKSIIQNSETRIVALGGAATTADALIGADKASALKDYLNAGANWDMASSPGVPIGYRVNYFDDTQAALAFATTYQTSKCRMLNVVKMHVQIHTEDDDKDDTTPIQIAVSNGRQTVGSITVGGGETWHNWDNRGYDIPIQTGTSLNLSDCRNSSVSVSETGERPGWRFHYELTGTLEDGTANYALETHGDKIILGDNNPGSVGDRFNGCAPAP